MKKKINIKWYWRILIPLGIIFYFILCIDITPVYGYILGVKTVIISDAFDGIFIVIIFITLCLFIHTVIDLVKDKFKTVEDRKNL